MRRISLTGSVVWLYQKEAAERAVRHIRVDNRIAVQSFHDSKIDEVDEMCETPGEQGVLKSTQKWA